jgi:amidase
LKYFLDRNNYCFSFCKTIKPVIRVKSGDEITFQTRDAHNGTVPSGGDVVFPDIDLKYANPITGPVYIEGAKPGNILKIEIKGIRLETYGFVPARNNMGTIPDIVSENKARNLKVVNDVIVFSKDVKIPVRPMVGTIGVSPSEGEIPSAFAGSHGGNMDNNDITVGSIVYLPIFIDGAFLAIGDVHASMGDGELTSGGVDINAEVAVAIDVIDSDPINRPIVETEDYFITTSDSNNFYEATRIATSEMIKLLEKGLGVSEIEAYWLISICGDLKVSQACNCPMGLTLRLAFPKNKEFLSWKTIF